MQFPQQERKEKRNTFLEALAALKLGLDAYSTYQQGDIAEKKIQYEQEKAEQARALELLKLSETQRQHTERLDIDRQKLGVDQQKLALETGKASPDERPFSMIQTGQALTLLKNLGVSDTHDLATMVKSLQKEGAPNAQALDTLMRGYQTYREEIGINLAQKLAQLDPSDPRQAKQAKQLQQAIEIIQSDETGDTVVAPFFGETIQAMKRKESEAANKHPLEKVVGPDGQVTYKTRAEAAGQRPYISPKDSFVTAGRGVFDLSGGKPKLVATAPQAEPTAATWSKPMQDEGGEYQISSKGEKQYTRKDKAEAKPTPKVIADAEAKISANIDNEAASSYADMVNQHSKNPYAWVYQGNENSRYIGDRKVWNAGKWKKAKLPVMDGKQATSAEVWYTAEKNGMTYDDVLRKIGAIK